MSLALPDFIKRAVAYFDKADANLTASEQLTAANAKIAALETELATLKAASTDFTVKITALSTEVETSKSALAAKDTELKNAQTQIETEKRRALDVLAAQGIAPDALPATTPNESTAGAQLDPVSKLRAQLEASTDAQEKYKLSVQIRELLAKARK